MAVDLVILSDPPEEKPQRTPATTGKTRPESDKSMTTEIYGFSQLPHTLHGEMLVGILRFCLFVGTEFRRAEDKLIESQNPQTIALLAL